MITSRVRIIAFVLTALLAAAASPAMAEDVKIGVADLQRALNESVAGEEAKKDLQAQAAGLEDELGAEQQELKKLKEEIDQKGSVWNDETRAEKERRFKTRSKKFQDRFMAYGEELNKKKKETEARIINELRDVVRELAREQGYSYIFEKSVGGLLYAPEGADVTDEVIERYDRMYKTED